MKRKFAVGFILCYLATLSFGVASHALQYHAASHPAMYFIVWDMFCGWAGYETRLHVIGEGESGRYYELAPSPWKEIRPFGDLARHHYDPFVNHAFTMANATLRHTDHEPMRRIHVVEEAWAKKFNLPDQLWQARYVEAKQPHSYYHLRKSYGADGTLLSSQQNWFEYQSMLALHDNPRLGHDARRSKPFYEVHPLQRSRNNDLTQFQSEPTSPQLLVQSERKH